MLTIKDFKTNDPAVILTMNHGRNEDPVISEVKIGSVGRGGSAHRQNNRRVIIGGKNEIIK